MIKDRWSAHSQGSQHYTHATPSPGLPARTAPGPCEGACQNPASGRACDARRARSAKLAPGAGRAAACQMVGQRGRRGARLRCQRGRLPALALVACSRARPLPQRRSA